MEIIDFKGRMEDARDTESGVSDLGVRHKSACVNAAEEVNVIQ